MSKHRQLALPGMGRKAHFAVGATPAVEPLRQQGYQGPTPGQLLMGVHDLGQPATDRPVPWREGIPRNPQLRPRVQEFAEHDPHGFVYEQFTDPTHHDAAAGFQRASHLYMTHGGAFAKTHRDLARQYGYGEGHTEHYRDDMGVTPSQERKDNARAKEVRAHWSRQPTVHLPTTAIVHTGQPHDDTEGDAPWTGQPGEGRERIEAIKSDLAGKGPNARIRKPAWVVKQGGRLFALDGHHRIVAAREAGLSHVPVKLWDRDAEREQGIDTAQDIQRPQRRRTVQGFFGAP